MTSKPNLLNMLFHRRGASPMDHADAEFEKAKEEVIEAEGRIRDVLLDLLDENDRLRSGRNGH